MSSSGLITILIIGALAFVAFRAFSNSSLEPRIVRNPNGLFTIFN